MRLNLKSEGHPESEIRTATHAGLASCAAGRELPNAARGCAGFGRRASAFARPRQQAFTLVELLLVLMILGILAAIVIPKFAGRTEQAKEAAAKTQLAVFRTALDGFEVDNGYYPKGKGGLVDLIQCPRDAQNWHGPYLQTDVIPKDPWGNDYTYECPGKHNPSFYDLWSSGPPGGDNVIANWTIQKR